MKSIFLISILVISLLIGYVYFNVELPKRNSISDSFVNLSLSAEFENKKVETILIIEEREINTSNVYELINIRKGVYQISNKNLKDQYFYRELKEFNITKDTRIDFALSKPKEVISKVTESNSIIKIEVKSENFQNVRYCLKYSINYIFVKSIDKTEIKKLDGYNGWDKCYSLETSLINSNETIYISYTSLGNTDSIEYIDLVLIDMEYLGIYQNKENNLDIGGKDLIINIK